MTHRRSRRALALWAGIVALLVLLTGVVAAWLQTPHTIVPPEARTLLAERPVADNLYDPVLEASEVLVKPYVDKGNWRVSTAVADTWWQLPGTMVLDYDDPETVARARSAAAALHRMREARNTPYLHVPNAGEEAGLDFYRRIRGLGEKALANAYYSQRLGKPANESVAQLLDVWWFYHVLAGQNGYWTAELSGTACVVFTAVLRNAAPDAQALESTLTELNSYSIMDRPLAEDLTRSLRDSEQRHARQGLWREDGGPGENLEEWWNGVRRRRYTREHVQELYGLANLDTAEFVQRYRSGRIPFDNTKWLIDPRTVFLWHEHRAQALSLERGLRLAVYIELYRSRHGVYPALLDDVVRDFPNAEATDAFGDQPFVYSAADDDYLLYSCGLDGVDDLPRMDKPVRDLYIHTPRVRFDDVLTPEAADIAARRRSPENAHCMLAEALKLIPQNPAGIDPQDTSGFRSNPDLISDPVATDWWTNTMPAAVKVREALGKPFLMWPDQENLAGYWDDNESRKLTERICRFLVARAVYFCLSNRDADEAVASSLDALRVCHMAMRDGSGERLDEQVFWLARSSEALALVLQRRPQTDAALMKLLEQIRALDFTARPLPECALENIRRGVAETMHEDWWQALQKRRYLKLYLREFVDLHNADPCEAELYAAQPPGGYMREYFGSPTHLLSLRQETVALQQGLAVVLYLELYRAYRGIYPESLDALAAEFPDAAPAIAVCGIPFGYETAGGDYSLSGLPQGIVQAQQEKEYNYYEWRTSAWSIHTPYMF